MKLIKLVAIKIQYVNKFCKKIKKIKKIKKKVYKKHFVCTT